MERFLAWLLESSLLVLMIFGIRKAFAGKIRYAGIYALWLLVLLRFLIPVNLLSTPFSAANLCSGALSAWNTVQALGQEADAAAGDVWQDKKGETNLSGAAAGISSGEDGQNHQKKNGTKYGMQGESPDRGQVSWEKNNVQSGGTDWWLFLQRVWPVGSVILFLWIFLSNLCLLGQMKSSRKLYGQRGKVKIYTVCGIQTPCLYGFFRPAIYLPSSLLLADGGKQVSGEELEKIITHEFVHYLHLDHIWAMLRMLLVSVYWFDPFVWMASSCSKKDAELFCDETVIRLLGEEERFSYGEMLVRLAGEPGWGEFRFSMLPMSRKGREMERRICAISVRKKYSKWIIIPLAAASLVAVSVTCSAGIGTFEWRRGQAEEPSGDAVASKAAVSVAKVSTGQAAEGASADHPLSEAVQENQRLLQNRASDASEYNEVPVYADTSEQAFDHYMEIFTNAVNTGNTDRMSQVLDPGSGVYEQQCNLVKNYYKRGIREQVKSYSITSVRVSGSAAGADSVKIDSKENIKVFYADGTSKVVKQRYRYFCQCFDGNWLITDMKELPLNDRKKSS